MSEDTGKNAKDNAALASPSTQENGQDGDIRIRIGIIWMLGIVTCMLIAGGITASVIKPENAKDIWLILGPIVPSLITGAVITALVRPGYGQPVSNALNKS